MKTLSVSLLPIILAGACICLPLRLVSAEDTNSSPAQSASPQPAGVGDNQAAAPSALPKLPYGVDDVLKLSRAQISDDIVLNYIHNSGTIYNLGPQEIVYLRNQGVSDRVINAMLDQRKQVTEPAAQTAPVPSAPTVSVAPAQAAPEVPVAPDYAQVAPQATPASSVYVIPSPAANPYYSYYYYPYYGYYGPYGYYYRPYCAPYVSFGFRYGGYGYWHGGHYHGGHYTHGGGHYH